MHRMGTTLVALGVAATTVLATAGCGSDQASVQQLHGSPHQQVMTAFENLTSGDTLTGTLRLGADATSLLQFGAHMSGDNLTSRQAQALAGAAISFTVHSTSGSLRSLADQQQQALVSGKAQQFDLAFNDQGRQYAELRVVDGNLYVQADVKGIIALVGQPSSVYDKALRQANTAPGSLKRVANAFMTGKWVELPGSQLKALEQKIRSQAGPNTLPSPNALQRRQFLASL